MISIGIFQDSPQQRKRIRQYCGQFLTEKGVEFRFLDFTSEKRLLEYRKNRIHLLFLDTRYQHSIDGIALMHRLEKYENISHIVFLSDCVDRLIDSFGEKTIGFCLRPLNYDLVAMWLGRLLKLNCSERIVDLMNHKESIPVSTDDIQFIQTYRNYSIVTTRSGEFPCTVGLKYWEEMVRDTSILRVHKLYLVNLKFIKDVKNDAVILNRCEIPLGRNYEKQLKDRMQNYHYHRMRVELGWE